jgi:hypothetical protein
MKNDASSVAPAGSKPADTVAQIHSIAAFRTLNRPVVYGEYDGVALLQRNNLGSALHAGPLLCQHEFTTGEVLAGHREQDRDLQRKRQISIEVLVQAVEVARHILQQQRRGPRLPSFMTLLEEVRMRFRIAARPMPMRSFQALATKAKNG